MAHFARLDENNIVLEVIVINNSELLDINGNEKEELGIAWLINWSNGYPYWKQTSYNNKFRKNYAGHGYTYDWYRDAFIPPKPYNSWTLDETTCQWLPPISKPIDNKKYTWNESDQTWDEVN